MIVMVSHVYRLNQGAIIDLDRPLSSILPASISPSTCSLRDSAKRHKVSFCFLPDGSLSSSSAPMSSVVSQQYPTRLLRDANLLPVIVQSIGAGLVGVSTSAFFEDEPVAVSYEKAGHIMQAGLALQVSMLLFSVQDGDANPHQIFAWVVFIAFLIVAMFRAYRQPHLQSKRYDTMRYMLWVILFSSLMLIWRAAFRCAEAALGYLNGPATNEPMFACFEFVPVILAVGLWSIIPPSRYIEDKLPGSQKRAEAVAVEEKPKLVPTASEDSDASTIV